MKYSARQVAAARRKAREALASGTSAGTDCTDFAATHAVNELVLLGGLDQTKASDVLAAVIAPFVEVIAGAPLAGDDSQRIQAAVNNFHILCSLCALALKAVEEARQMAAQLAEEIASDVVASVNDDYALSDQVKIVLQKGLRRAFEAVIDIVADPAKIKALQLVGFISCPDVSEHPEVRQYCVRPLVGGLVTTAVSDWIEQGFPAGSSVLCATGRRTKR
ncbi:MAG: hypothetical protein LBH76_07475 [Propionibacteriaceae bacterium]|nr:hypothetical protein [Propionibacteriaceae bacterium]